MTARRVVEVGELLDQERPVALSVEPLGNGWEELPPLEAPAAAAASVRPADLEAMHMHPGLPEHKRLAFVNLRRRWDGLEPVTEEQLAAAEARRNSRNRKHMTPAGRRVAEPTSKEMNQ